MGPDQYWDKGYHQFLKVNKDNRHNLQAYDQDYNQNCCAAVHSKSPFIRVTLGKNTVSALWDTGSDLSLIAADKIKEGIELTPVMQHETPQAVEGSKVNIKGKMTLNVQIGTTMVKQHTFYVVQGLVVPYLLGADFQARLGEFIMDWRKGELRLEDGSCCSFYYSYQSSSAAVELQSVVVRPAETIELAAGTETAVLCNLDKPLSCNEVLIEPITQQNELVGVCRIVTRPKTPQQVILRVANVDSQVQTLYKNQKLAWANPNFEVGLQDLNPQFSSDSRKINYQTDETLDPNHKRALDELIQHNNDIFYVAGDQLGSVQFVEHEIPLQPNAVPVAQRPRRLSPSEREEVREEINYLLSQGLIETSTSPWASPIVIARRKNGRLRLAIDYRRLNSLTINSHYPLPVVDDLLDRLSNAKFFSTLDAKSGYWQMPLRGEDCYKTAFVTPDGQYEWTGRGTPFGLSGAPGSFQRLMTAILGELSWTSALAYLDDVIVWSQTWEEHLRRLGDVFDQFRKAGMKLNAEKCRFGQRKIEFLGHIISSRGLEIDAGRISDLQNIPRPTTVTDLRKALGAFSYLQRYIPGFADIAKPLYQLIEGKKNTVLKWTKEHDNAFLELKKTGD